MTHQKWEYASVVWTYTTRQITSADPEFERLPPEKISEGRRKGWASYFWGKQELHIRLPGTTETDTRVSWETPDADYKVRMTDIFNELGSDGWEMVSHTVEGNSMGTSYGWLTASRPINTRTIFKRPVSE